MNQESPKESSSSIKPQAPLKISARKNSRKLSRICQADIFENIEVIEDIETDASILRIKKLSFPYIICLNQECDLESDYGKSGSDGSLLHLAIAPAFLFESFLKGNHWAGILSEISPQKRKGTKIKNIMDNEIPRYHYIKFPDPDMPELIVDFKHFFSISRATLYAQIDKRLCSMDDLFREKVSQRFSYYLSRIGLPEHVD